MVKEGKTMRLTAIIREGRNGNMKSMSYDDYKTKQHFARDVRANGYRLIDILTDGEIETIATRRDMDIADEMRLYTKHNRKCKDYFEYIDQVLYADLLERRGI